MRVTTAGPNQIKWRGYEGHKSLQARQHEHESDTALVPGLPRSPCVIPSVFHPCHEGKPSIKCLLVDLKARDLRHTPISEVLPEGLYNL